MPANIKSLVFPREQPDVLFWESDAAGARASRPRPFGAEDLRDFLALAAGSGSKADAIRELAKRVGFLGLCEHGLPASHNHPGIGGDFDRDDHCVATFREPLADWRRFALLANALRGIALATDENEQCDFREWHIAKHLHQGLVWRDRAARRPLPLPWGAMKDGDSSPPFERVMQPYGKGWDMMQLAHEAEELAYGDVPKRKTSEAEDIDEQRRFLTVAFKDWLFMAGVRAFIAWDRTPRSWVIGADSPPSLLAAVGAELAAEASRAESLVSCAICGARIIENPRGHRRTGVNRFCGKDCFRKWDAQRKRDQRRKAQGVSDGT